MNLFQYNLASICINSIIVASTNLKIQITTLIVFCLACLTSYHCFHGILIVHIFSCHDIRDELLHNTTQLYITRNPFVLVYSFSLTTLWFAALNLQFSGHEALMQKLVFLKEIAFHLKKVNLFILYIRLANFLASLMTGSERCVEAEFDHCYLPSYIPLSITLP